MPAKVVPPLNELVFFKLQLVIFFEDIRSQRLLMQYAADRLSILWYLVYDLGERLPYHSCLTRIRTRSGVEVFRRFFEAVVDATKVNANASMDSVGARSFTGTCGRVR
jgi:hypothetical protein